jgi:hypothetical protein
MRIETHCLFYQSSGDSKTGCDCGWCELDRTHAVCHREIRDCEMLKSLKKNLMEREWMKVKRGNNRYSKSNSLIP